MSILLTPGDVATLDDLPDGTAYTRVTADDNDWLQNDRTTLQEVAYTANYLDLLNLPPLAAIATSGYSDDLIDGVTNRLYTNDEKNKLVGIADYATANSSDAILCNRANHTGTESADVIIDGTTNKVFTGTMSTKLAGIATSATANSSDATLLARANHTGTQAASTITGLSTVATSGSYPDLSNKPSIPSTFDNLTDGTTNKAYTSTEKTKLAGIASGATVNIGAYEGTALRTAATLVIKTATVSSGTAVFQITADGTSTGTALFPTGPIVDSVNLTVNDATAAYQMSWAWSNSNKTLTVTANKLTTANILSGILGQTAANAAVVKLTVWGY